MTYGVVEVLSANNISLLLLIKNTKTNDIVNTIKPIEKLNASCAVDGRKKMRADISLQVDSVHVEYLFDFQS